MVCVNKIKGLMAEHNITGIEMAKSLNIAPKTFYDKMKKGIFGTDEVDKIVEILNIQNPAEIFFAKELT